ncbi:MAG TPA: hypothetical protein VJ256_01835, partial [Dehalococcoidia bacterium]|nr:hypothetical protein [Dehalococcoidia bacterium]
QSGFLVRYFADALYQRGLRLSKGISLGNQCDLDCVDFLEYFAQDSTIGVLAAYLEGLKDGRGLRRALAAIAPQKPVVLWKAGLTGAGARAAASHTGSLTGRRDAWQALLRQTGAIPASGLEELIDLTMALALLPKALGDRFAIISDPGGLAVGAADACEESGLSLATISPETEAKLRQFMIPVGASPKNPIDIGMMSFQPLEVYREAAVVAAQDPGVDAILVQPIVFNARTIDLIIEAKMAIDKPFLVSPVLTDLWGPELARKLAEAGIPNFPSPERAMRAYAAARRYHRFRSGE